MFLQLFLVLTLSTVLEDRGGVYPDYVCFVSESRWVCLELGPPPEPRLVQPPPLNLNRFLWGNTMLDRLITNAAILDGPL